MPELQRRFLTGLLLFLGAGLAIGWLYGRPLTGLLIAALVALAHITRQLFNFSSALTSLRLDDSAFGNGIWANLVSRVSFLRERGRKHKRRHRRLLREVRDSTNAMPDGGIVLNRSLEIVLGNQAARHLAGIRMPQDRGQRIDNFLRDPQFVDYLNRRAWERARTVEFESPLHPDNWLSCQIVPFGANQYLLLIRDITERIRINRMRRDFVANASHELRSPLTVISGYLDTLSSDGDVPDGWREPVAEMRTQAERMNRVVAKLLELSRLENPGSVREEHAIDVAAQLALARRAWAGQDGVAEIRSDVTLTAKLSGVVEEIESVIGNLLANAVRHTPADGTITLSWTADADGGGCLAVTDTGEGVAKEHIPRLTERFFRVDEGRSRDAGGVGLGLAIVKHALARHDATLAIDSVVGAGSRFACHFPGSRLIGADIETLVANRGTG